jgi:hypothetical protein
MPSFQDPVGIISTPNPRAHAPRKEKKRAVVVPDSHASVVPRWQGIGPVLMDWEKLSKRDMPERSNRKPVDIASPARLKEDHVRLINQVGGKGLKSNGFDR